MGEVTLAKQQRDVPARALEGKALTEAPHGPPRSP